MRAQGARDITVDIGTNTLLFTVGAGVLVRDSVNVTIAGGVVAYDPPANTQGVLSSPNVTGNVTEMELCVDNGCV